MTPSVPTPPPVLDELEIGEVAHRGVCVARHEGRVVFVRHALPGEVVRARVTEAAHDRYWRADAVDILRASPDRVTAPCPHARPGGCGGCDWQHASLPAQRRLKGVVVAESLRRIAGLDLPVEVEALPADRADGLGWRTRMRFALTPAGQVGLRVHRSHQVEPTPDCRIAHPSVVGAVAEARFPGVDVVDAVAMPGRGGAAVSTEPGRWRFQPAAATVERGPEAAEAGPEPVTEPGAEAVTEVVETVRGREFHLDPGVFWQVHPAAAATLTAAVLDALAPVPGETALDLYSGAGLFAAALAQAVGPTGSVIALDSDRTAIEAAARSLADLPWASPRPVPVTPATVRRVRGRVGGAGVAGWTGAGAGVDLAVLDPPRSGAGAEVMAALLAHRPRRVAYVACDPATLGRDLVAAAAAGYRLVGLRAFDLFPMTFHVECVATLAPAGAAGSDGREPMASTA